MKQPETELNYRAAYLRLFGDVAALAARIETAGARMSMLISRVHPAARRYSPAPPSG